jgi:hypothetical protein
MFTLRHPAKGKKMIDRSSIPTLKFWTKRARKLSRIADGQPRTIVTIPARDEAVHLGPCLLALSKQQDLQSRKIDRKEFGVLLLLNNCNDDSPAIAAKIAKVVPYTLRIEHYHLPPHMANAGFARRLAMDAAAGWLLAAGRPDGAILTTDADTRVAPDWVARQDDAFVKNIDAVAGYVLDDLDEYQSLPLALRRRGELEDRYARLLVELECLLDPVAWDPWPRHGMASGASLGVELEWYRRVGGLPLRPCGEDRALLQCLAAAGARIRHCSMTRVTTSCRLVGRAAGGMAETMAARIADPDALCDEELLPAFSAFRRLFWRVTLRHRHTRGQLAVNGDWINALGLSRDLLSEAILASDFSSIWETLLRKSPHLNSRRLHPLELPGQISRVEQLIRDLRLDPSPADFNRIVPQKSPAYTAHPTDIALPASTNVTEGLVELSV